MDSYLRCIPLRNALEDARPDLPIRDQYVLFLCSPTTETTQGRAVLKGTY
jgi:hypothetical protein